MSNSVLPDRRATRPRVPHPCRLFAWSGNKHYSPAMSEDGRQCEDYRDRSGKTRAQNHGLATKSAETCHGGNAPDVEIDDSAADTDDPVDVVAEGTEDDNETFEPLQTTND